jgi:hypothetical protein
MGRYDYRCEKWPASIKILAQEVHIGIALSTVLMGAGSFEAQRKPIEGKHGRLPLHGKQLLKRRAGRN